MEIRGNTLRVYLHILKHGPSELRDIQREVGLSTPSLASYHLAKLVELGYAKQDSQGRYLASERVPEEILVGYSKIGTAVVPQLFFFAVLFTILTCYFAYEVVAGANLAYYLIGIAAAMVATLWYETARLWRKLA